MSPAVGDRPVVFDVTDSNGVVHIVVLLSRDLADQCLHVQVRGRDRLLISRHAVRLDGAELVVAVPNDEAGALQVFPCDDLPGAAGAFMTLCADLACIEAPGVDVELLQVNATPPALRWGPRVAWREKSTPLAPPDAAYAAATRLRLKIPPGVPCDRGRVLLTLDYVGDAARLYADGQLVDDHFYDGEPWAIGIDRFVRGGVWPQFELAILAADPDLPIFLEPAARARQREVSSPTLLHARLRWWRDWRVGLGA